jgi:hypothetical protein
MSRTELLLNHSRIVCSIRTSVYTSRQPKVGELEVAVLIYQNIVRFDVPNISSIQRGLRRQGHAPMDKAEIVHGFDGKRALSHVKPGHVFGENIIFHQHRH